jgi:hypothetical protein
VWEIDDNVFRNLGGHFAAGGAIAESHQSRTGQCDLTIAGNFLANADVALGAFIGGVGEVLEPSTLRLSNQAEYGTRPLPIRRRARRALPDRFCGGRNGRGNSLVCAATLGQ